MRKSRYLVGAAAVVTAILAIGGGLEVHLALAGPNFEQAGIERPAFEPTPIDRTIKGDRLPGARGEHPGPQLRLPDGCEPRFSFTSSSSLNALARRCVT